MGWVWQIQYQTTRSKYLFWYWNEVPCLGGTHVLWFELFNLQRIVKTKQSCLPYSQGIMIFRGYRFKINGSWKKKGKREWYLSCIEDLFWPIYKLGGFFEFLVWHIWILQIFKGVWVGRWWWCWLETFGQVPCPSFLSDLGPIIAMHCLLLGNNFVSDGHVCNTFCPVLLKLVNVWLKKL